MKEGEWSEYRLYRETVLPSVKSCNVSRSLPGIDQGKGIRQLGS